MQADVAIIGAGPVGLTLANLLGRRGLSVTICERQKSPYGLPRAVHFDGEAMRIFQAAGLAEAILPITRVHSGMQFRDARGRLLVDWSREQVIGATGWHESYRFHQPDLEDVLTGGLDRFANVRLVRGVAVENLAQNADHVLLRIADGTNETARFAVACDGAQSPTRAALGIGTEDLGFDERWLVIDTILTAPRPDLGHPTIQHCDPVHPATYVCGIGDRRRWEIRLEPDRPEPEDDAAIWSALRPWITADEARLERAAVYRFRSAIARDWQRGRIFLAGDAAHQMPPFMGQGLCAGLRDAANLGWKLAAVLGGAPCELLQSYASERRPHVRAFIDRTIALGKIINQTAAGAAPAGPLRSLWPRLGPGLGTRTGPGGWLAPQPITDGGARADDFAGGGFHILGPDDAGTRLPRFPGADGWLADHGVSHALVRPDGYCAGGGPAAAVRQMVAAMAARGLA